MKRFYLFCWEYDLLKRRIGCKKSGEPSVPPPPLAVTGISPQQGITGSTLSIKRTSFGNDVTLVKVTVNGKDAVVESVTDTVIKVKIPLKAGSGQVKVAVAGVEAAAPHLLISSQRKILKELSGRARVNLAPIQRCSISWRSMRMESWSGHDEAQDLNNGTWKVEDGQLYFRFISTGSTVKADITDDFKLKNIQNNIYNATNDAARQWKLLSCELDTLTELALNNMLWQEAERRADAFIF